MKYIVVNIGCIECGVSSDIVGVFTSKKKAEEIAEKLGSDHDWRGGGQNSYEVFEHPKMNTINEEYKDFF